MNKLFTIGEMARLFGINAKTLRYYDETGLVKPEEVDPATGYRYYSTEQFERLNTIRYLRALNMPLEKISRFFENRDIAQMVLILKEQQEEVRKKQAELERIGRKLEERLSQLHDAAYTVYGQVEERVIPERKTAMLRTGIPATDDLEYPIRRLEQETHLKAAMFLGKVGVSIDRDHLLQHKFDEFSSIFVVLEPMDDYEGERPVEGISPAQALETTIPAGEYLVLRYCGTHTQSAGHYGKMLRYLEERQYRLSGSSVEITLIDAGITNDTSKFVTELQLPFTRSC